MRTLNCSDAGFDCKAVVKADTDNEVMRIAADHAQAAHGVILTPEMAQQLKTLIKEELPASL
jgi:predicted small metal-binding protein